MKYLKLALSFERLVGNTTTAGRQQLTIIVAWDWSEPHNIYL